MESPIEGAASKNSFSQVLFNDIPHSYPPSSPVTCRYTLTAGFQPNTRDWVGIFKVGWNTAKDYHTFVWVEPCLDVVGQQPVTKHIIFHDYYLPKDEIEFYQFCYVGTDGQVRGASTPFCFKNPVEQNLENGPDDDLLVITTQEQVEQTVREKAELMKELDQIKEENRKLSNSLQQQQEEVNSLKEQNERKEEENCKLVKEVDQMKEKNESLISAMKDQVQENDLLKKELLIRMTQQLEIEQQNNTEQENQSQSTNLGEASKQEEKYDQAVIKINQLKEQREELRGRTDIQCTEIDALTQKVRKGEQEILKLRDNIQLLQVDLQSSEKEKERLCEALQRLQNLSDDMKELRRENQELQRRLSEQETLQNIPDDNLKVQCHTLLKQLQDAQAQLAAEREKSKSYKRQAEQMEREMLQVTEQLQHIIGTCEQAQRKSSKLELQLTEAHGVIAERDGLIEERDNMIMIERREKEELAKENQNLRRDIEGLRREFADLQTAPPADSPPMQPSPPRGSPADSTSTSPEWREQDTSPESQYENLYETIGNISHTEEEEEQPLVCRHCQESFPGLTQDELEQHEQNHRVCPFCTLICDDVEQAVFEDHVYGHEL